MGASKPRLGPSIDVLRESGPRIRYTVSPDRVCYNGAAFLERGRAMKWMEKVQPMALLLLRLGLALVFLYHGLPKLFGDTAKFIAAFENLGLPSHTVYVVGVIETMGGLFLALGLYTSIAGVFLLLDMCAAMWKYNFNEGIYAVREYELPLVLGLAALVVASTGPGPFSLDNLLRRRKAASRS